METSYISCSTNSHSRSVDWGKNDKIVYGSSNAIAIYNPNVDNTGKIEKTLHKHMSKVKIVKWIKREEDKIENELLTASIDGTIIIWNVNDDDLYNPDINLSLGDSLTTADAIYIDDNTDDDYKKRDLLICGSSFNEIFSVWQRKSNSISEKQMINLNGKITTEVLFAFLPGKSKYPIIITGLDDSTIKIFAWENYKNELIPNFNNVRTLSGHQDWIQCFDYIKNNNNESILVTGSQDGTIRLWKILIAEDKPDDEKINQFKIGNEEYEIIIESVLSGHEHRVYGVNWMPSIIKNGKLIRQNKLLSCALDQSMIVWSPNDNGVWTENVRLGKVGGNTLGYYGCKFSGDGTSVLAHGYKGTFHMWKFNNELDRWLPLSVPSGHNSDVTDIHWDPKGRYLISTSLDQTTRIHVPWKINNINNKINEIWKEYGRPQIHGYDINSIEILTPTMFASGADEKVIRIFEAPNDFINCLNNEKWINLKNKNNRAEVPALGLTNKSFINNDNDNDNNIMEENFNDDDINNDRGPTEEEIIRHTLWPEIEKLYGHGYEIFSMASRHDAKLLATACKSNNEEHSSILLWSTITWGHIQKLKSHRLTVSQMEFSPNDKYLISVSRDRRWSLYYCQDDNDINYKLVGISPTSGSLHTRIIWCCAWTHDSKYFSTGSRDGKIGIWNADNIKNNYNNNEKPITSAELEIKGTSVTALSFSPGILDTDNYILAIGFEEGTINIQKLTINNDKSNWNCCFKIDTSFGHHKTVKKLSFRPILRSDIIQLASCGSDGAVKIHDININKILNC